MLNLINDIQTLQKVALGLEAICAPARVGLKFAQCNAWTQICTMGLNLSRIAEFYAMNEVNSRKAALYATVALLVMVAGAVDLICMQIPTK